MALGAGCRRESPSGAGPSKKVRVGVTLLTTQHAFYQDLQAGLEAKAREYGYELLITSGDFQAARQANQIDEFIVQRVDALVVCPCDSRSVGASIAAANDAAVPVFTADIANLSPLGKVVAHVASDNKQGGRRAAEMMVQAIGGAGAVAILSHPEVTSVQDRVLGFKEYLAQHPEVRLVAELSSEGKRDKAVRIMEDLLQSQPDLAGVFGINDDSALGALAAIEAAGKLGTIKIVGYDATPEARRKIEERAIYGDVVQDPRRIGELTVDAIHDHFSGKPPPAVIPVQVGVFTGQK